jgi:hypothetical protein
MDDQNRGPVAQLKTVTGRVEIENEGLQAGYAFIPNWLLQDGTISFGARLTYAVLLRYAWSERRVFPGQAQLGQVLGVSRKAVGAYLRELRQKAYVSYERRGGQPAVYWLRGWGMDRDVPRQAIQMPTSQLDPQPTLTPTPPPSGMATPTATIYQHGEDHPLGLVGRLADLLKGQVEKREGRVR